MDDGIPDNAKSKRVDIPYTYLHSTLSDFVRAQENTNTRIVPYWEDGSDIEIEPEPPELEDETEEENSSSSDDCHQEEWTPGH